MKNFIRLSVLISLLALPIITWAYIKPFRVLAPELLGLTCVDSSVCVDDPLRLEEAQKLYADAIDFVQENVDEIRAIPRVIFCSGTACSSKFGLHKGSYGYAGAYNVGTFGIVISYRGWHPYYVRHELIHHLQNERLGSFNAWFFKPVWFKEGMAYSLSKDPRHPLPQPLESFRKDYNEWAKDMNTDQVWHEAGKL